MTLLFEYEARYGCVVWREVRTFLRRQQTHTCSYLIHSSHTHTHLGFSTGGDGENVRYIKCVWSHTPGGGGGSGVSFPGEF